MCLLHYLTFYFPPNFGSFYFTNVPLSPRLLCVFFFFFLFVFFSFFFTLTSSCLHWFWRLCGCFCVCAIRWGEWGAKGVTSGGPVTCELELNLWCMSPHFSRLAALHSENSCFDWNVVVVGFFWHYFFLLIPFATLHEKQNLTFYWQPNFSLFAFTHKQELFGQECQRTELNCRVSSLLL